MKTVEMWRAALRGALREAMRARQADAVAILREALSAIDQAEAPPMPEAQLSADAPIAGSVSGLGAGEVERLALSPQQVEAILARELSEREQAAADYARLGQAEHAARLTRQAEVLRALLA